MGGMRGGQFLVPLTAYGRQNHLTDLRIATAAVSLTGPAMKSSAEDHMAARTSLVGAVPQSSRLTPGRPRLPGSVGHGRCRRAITSLLIGG